MNLRNVLIGLIFGIVIGMIACPRAKAVEVYSVTTVRSYHTDRSAGYNENNLGVGLEVKLNSTWAVVGGEYKNSFRNISHYYGLAITPFDSGHWHAGILVATVSGYDSSDIHTFQPVIIPLVTYERNNWGINSVIAPPLFGRSGVAGFQLKFKF